MLKIKGGRRLTLGKDSAPMRHVKFVLPLALLAAFALSACNTLENRRSLYTTERVHGPYTRQLEEGTWGNPKTVDEEYSDAQAQRSRPKVVPGEKKPMVAPAGATPAVTPDAPLPAQ
jgi:hypothetical protein